jgi:hypothetical protein
MLSVILGTAGGKQQAESRPLMGFVDDGNKHGLTDVQGREKVPAIYAQLSYIGHGLFLARKRSTNPADKFGAEDKILIDQEGSELKLKVPAGTNFETLFWLGEQTKTKLTQMVPGKLSRDALLVYSSGKELGLCNSDGNIILPAKFTRIGYPTEDFAILQAKGAQSFIYDARKRKLLQISYANLQRDCLQGFSNGLAQFKVINIAKPGCFWGYLDTSGKVAIKPKFNWAAGFVKGQAFVTLLDDKLANGAVINKSGNVISPPQLGISEFHGDYAVAATTSGKKGVVNRSFKYVIAPEYESLVPQTVPYYSEEDAWKLSSQAPLFYYANKSQGAPTVVLSLQGKVLFELPKGAHPLSVENGVLICNVVANDTSSKLAYLDLKGHKVAPPLSYLSESNSTATFRAVAPGVLLKTIDGSNDAFDVNYWAQGRSAPVSRLNMFNRFLKQYNLIGMDEETVVGILGDGNNSQPADYKGHLVSIEHRVASGGCLPELTEYVKISFKDNRVDHWCFKQRDKESAPITSNVVLKFKSKSARIGEQTSATWPETTPKSH